MKRIHPGEILRELFLKPNKQEPLDLLIIVAARNSKAIYASEWKEIERVCEGKAPLTKPMIEVVAEGTNTPRELWNNLQALYYSNLHPLI